MVDRLLKFKQFCDELLADVFVDVVGVPAPPPSATLASTSSVPMDVDPKPIPTQRITGEGFYNALRDAFSEGFRARRNKPAEMIAKHLDKAMRKGQKGKEDAAFKSELDRVLALSRFTDEIGRAHV